MDTNNNVYYTNITIYLEWEKGSWMFDYPKTIEILIFSLRNVYFLAQ